MADVGIKISATDAASGVFRNVANEAGKLQGSLGAISASMGAFATTAIAGLSVLSFASQIKEAIDLADSFNKLSQKTGVAVDELSKLNYAAGLADVGTDALANGLKKLNISISAAANGSKIQADVFKSLGVNIKDAQGNVLSADKVFAQLSDRFADSADGANKTAVAVALLGKSGADLVPLLNGGSKSLKDLGDEATKLGIVLGPEFARNAEAFNDNLHKISVAGNGLFVTMGSEMVSALANISTEMANAAVQGGKLHAVIVGLDSLGNSLFDWEGNAQRKGIRNLEKDIADLRDQQKGLTLDIFGRGGVIQADLDKKMAALAKAKADYFKLTDGSAGAGRGTAPDPRVIKSLQSAQDSGAIRAAAASLQTTTGGAGLSDRFVAGREAAKEWAKSFEDFRKIAADARAETDGLSKAQARLLEYITSNGYANASESMRQLALNEAYAAVNAEELARATKQAAKESLEAINAYADAVDVQQRAADTLRDQVKAERESVAAIGLSTEALADLIAAKYEDQAVSKDNLATLADTVDASGTLGEAYRAQAKDLRELAALKRQGALKEVTQEAAKKAADEWKRTADQIENSITDALMRGFESGKGFAENLRDVVQNMFKTMVLRPVVQATVQGGLGALGIPGVGGSGGGIGGAINTASNLNTLFGAGSQALFGGAVGASTASLFGANAVGAVGGDALGALIAGNGAWAGVSAAGAASAAGGAAAGGAGALAAIPGWGWALGGALLLAGLTGGGGRYVQSTGETALGFDATGKETYRAPYRYPGIENAGANTFVTALNKTYLDAAKSLGIAAATSVFSFGGNNAESATGQGKFRLGASVGGSRFDSGEIARSDEAVKLAASRALLTVLSGSDLPKHLQGYLDKAGDAATMSQDQIDAILATASAFKGLHDTLLQLPFENLKDLSGEATQSLLTLAGGMDQFKAGLDSYYQAFYSADEQRAQAVANLIVSLNDVGLALPASRDAYRALVDAQDLATESGRKTYATLIGLSGAFASVTAATDAAMKSFVADGAKLQVDLLTALGDSVGAQAAQRAIAIAGLGDAAVAQYDYNQSLRDQISAANAAAAAAQNFVSALGSVAATRQSLEAQLLGAQGDTVGALVLTRKNELASLTQGLGAADAAKLTAAQQYNYALEDQIAALQNAKTAAEASARAQEEASRASDQLRQAWQSVTDSIFGEVKRIRDLMGGNSAQSYAQAQARFSITAAQASAGDQEAAKLLPSLSQALLTLAEAQATSLLQLRAIQGQTAGTLERIGGNYTAQYGLTVPKLATGTNYVPQDMLALIHQGEAVVPARYNPAAYNPGNGGGGNTEMVSEIQALRGEIASLRALQSSNNDSAKITADTLRRVTRGGEAMQVASDSSSGVEILAL